MSPPRALLPSSKLGPYLIFIKIGALEVTRTPKRRLKSCPTGGLPKYRTDKSSSLEDQFCRVHHATTEYLADPLDFQG